METSEPENEKGDRFNKWHLLPDVEDGQPLIVKNSAKLPRKLFVALKKLINDP